MENFINIQVHMQLLRKNTERSLLNFVSPAGNMWQMQNTTMRLLTLMYPLILFCFPQFYWCVLNSVQFCNWGSSTHRHCEDTKQSVKSPKLVGQIASAFSAVIDLLCGGNHCREPVCSMVCCSFLVLIGLGLLWYLFVPEYQSPSSRCV